MQSADPTSQHIPRPSKLPNHQPHLQPSTATLQPPTAPPTHTQHHEVRKRQLQKREKTLAANEAALRAAEKKAAAQLANLRNNAATAQVGVRSAWALDSGGVLEPQGFWILVGLGCKVTK
jgi:hypothetical protein